MAENPPKIRSTELLKFEVGKESPEDRTATGNDAAVLITVGNAPCPAGLRQAFSTVPAPFASCRYFAIGGTEGADFSVPCKIVESPLHLMGHMAVKLVLNTVSTGIMAVLGRVTGNWMSWVNVSNKKLMDRGIRLISEIGGIDYKTACIRIYEAIEELEEHRDESKEQESVVQYVLKTLPRK